MADIVFIDNFDSFTYNLVDQFRSLGHQVKIYRNSIATDTIVDAIEQLSAQWCCSLQGQALHQRRAVCQS